MNIILSMGMRAIPALISLVMLILFIAPLFSGIINLGNIFGIIMSASVLFGSVYYEIIINIAEKLKTNAFGRFLYYSAIILSAVVIILFFVITIFMIHASNDEPKSKDTTLIILGCKVKGDRPSLMLRRRLDAAYDFLSENKEINVIVSGGKGTDEKISEAECMKNYLIEKGIENERIFIEDKSTSTYENLKFSKEIIKNRNLPKKITIVTDGYHQLRAELIAKKLNYDSPYNISAHTALWLVPTYYVREWFGVTHQLLFG